MIEKGSLIRDLWTKRDGSVIDILTDEQMFERYDILPGFMTATPEYPLVVYVDKYGTEHIQHLNKCEKVEAQ